MGVYSIRSYEVWTLQPSMINYFLSVFIQCCIDLRKLSFISRADTTRRTFFAKCWLREHDKILCRILYLIPAVVHITYVIDSVVFCFVDCCNRQKNNICIFLDFSQWYFHIHELGKSFPYCQVVIAEVLQLESLGTSETPQW